MKFASFILLVCGVFCLCAANATRMASDTLGMQRTAVILLNTSGRDSSSLPRSDEINQAVFQGEYSANAFYQENSYGRVSLAGDIYGWYDAPELKLDCFLTPEKLFSLLNLKIQFSKYDRFIIFYSLAEGVCEGGSLGESTHGKQIYQTPQGNIRASISSIGIDHKLAKPVVPFQPLSGLASGVLTHELGHAFGVMAHANILHCGQKTFSTEPDECVQSGIADMFSIMGGEGFFRPALHLNACHKEELGWLPSPLLKTVNISAFQKKPMEIDIFPIEETHKNDALALRINLERPIPVAKDVEITALFLEYKTPFAMNRRLSELQDLALEKYRKIKFNEPFYKIGESHIDIDGVQIRGGMFREGKCFTTYLLDTKPGSIQWENQRYDLYDSLDSFLNPLQSAREPLNGILIENIGKNKNGSMRIRVSKNLNSASF